MMKKYPGRNYSSQEAVTLACGEREGALNWQVFDRCRWFAKTNVELVNVGEEYLDKILTNETKREIEAGWSPTVAISIQRLKEHLEYYHKVDPIKIEEIDNAPNGQARDV